MRMSAQRHLDELQIGGVERKHAWLDARHRRKAIALRDWRPVLVQLDRLRAELIDACDDASLAPRDLVVWVVDAAWPVSTTPIAYLRPGGPLNSLAVLEAVGTGRLDAHRSTAHRLALWRELPGIPEPALGPMLRHELEHARRWERSGPAFFDQDDRLRAAVRLVGGKGYAELPSEREANAAAAGYARRRLSAVELEELRSTPACANLLGAAPVSTEPAAAIFRLEHDREEPLVELVTTVRSAAG
jgi:hypothetical protein